jgi:hypothetical protein
VLGLELGQRLDLLRLGARLAIAGRGHDGRL